MPVILLRGEPASMEFLDFVEKYKLTLDIREYTDNTDKEAKQYTAQLLGCDYALAFVGRVNGHGSTADEAVRRLAACTAQQHILLPFPRESVPKYRQQLVTPPLTHTRKVSDVAVVSEILV